MTKFIIFTHQPELRYRIRRLSHVHKEELTLCRSETRKVTLSPDRYLELQRSDHFAIKQSSFFRGNSLFFLHFQSKIQKEKWHFY